MFKNEGICGMDKQMMESMREIIENLRKMNYIKPGEVPNIDLYMDQVTTFMDKHLESSKRFSEDKLLTKTMINNYTKNDLLPSPDKKKYTKDHLYILIFIFYLKSILSITDIRSIIKPLTEKFFDDKGEIGLEQIYEEIYEQEAKQAKQITKEIAKRFTETQESFADVKDEEQREFLRNFSFICTLGFDVYMKRQILEAIIDADIRQIAPIKNVYSQWKFKPVSVTNEHLFIIQETNVHTKT